MLPRLRGTLRSLASTPFHTGIVLLTLAVGLAISTSTFSVVNALLLHRWPFPRAHEVVSITAERFGQSQLEFSAIETQEIREQGRSFAAVTALTARVLAGGEPGQPAQRLIVMHASPEIFTTLGLSLIRGRGFTAEEAQSGGAPVVLLSEAFWKRQFGADPSVIGRTLELAGESVEIIGVVPATFEHLPLWGQAAGTADVWLPHRFAPENVLIRNYRSVHLIARLQPGTIPEQATAELAVLAARQSGDLPQDYTGLRYRVIPLPRSLLDATGTRVTWLLFGLSSFVLLIACANLANLQLVRTCGESHQLAVRSALGASPRSLMTHQFWQSGVLAVVGGALGCIGALLLNRAIEHRLEDYTRQVIAIDGRVLAVNLVAVAVATLLLAILPAWYVSRLDVGTALKAQSRGSSQSRGQLQAQRGLIIGEIALALVLLAGAGMMQRGLQVFLRHDPGWDAKRMVTAALPIPERLFDTPERLVAYLRTVEERMKALPEVEHAAIATSLPLPHYTSSRTILTPSLAGAPVAMQRQAHHVMVTSDYFAAMQIPLLEGRLFPSDIKRDDPQVAVINRALAQHLWPGQSAIGQRLASIDGGQTIWREVIGVVQDVESASDFRPPATPFQVYRPMVHEPWHWGIIAVRTQHPDRMVESVRRTLIEIDPTVPIGEVISVAAFIRRTHHNVHLIASILTIFSLLGLGLAALGVYSLMARAVTQRRVEFGVRMALGASRGDVLRQVLRDAVLLGAAGTAVGLIGALSLGYLIQASLPRLAGPDPVVLAATAAILLLATVAAAWWPARRAMTVDPIVAMRAG